MLSLDETIEKLAGGMLSTMASEGFVQPFVGHVNVGDEIWGDAFVPTAVITAEDFMDNARSKCEDLVKGGASIVVVGICVSLFNTGDPEMSKKFGLGGPGEGALYRNQEASLNITGKEAYKGIVVMAANRRDASAKLFVPTQKGSPSSEMVVDQLPRERMVEATKKLFACLPWPVVH